MTLFDLINKFLLLPDYLESKFSNDLTKLGKLYAFLSSIMFYFMLLFAKLSKGDIISDKFVLDVVF